MKKYFFLLLIYISALLPSSGQSLNVANLHDVALEEMAVARDIKLTGKLEAHAPWSKRGGTDWRQLRDCCCALRHLDLSQATAECVPANALHSRHRLQSIVLPQGIKEIGSQAFFSCDSIEEIIIPASVEKIGQSAFNLCRGLRKVVFEGAPKVEDFAFANCPLLQDIVVKGSRPQFSVLAFIGTRSIYEEDLMALDTLSSSPNIIPQPAVVRRANRLPLDWADLNGIKADKALSNEKRILEAILRESTEYSGHSLAGTKGVASLSIDPSLSDPEAYVLDADVAGLNIRGGSAAGVYWGIMTLRQLLLDSNGSSTRRYTLAAIHIEDQPRTHIREIMVDPARTFIPFDDLKALVPLLAQYKFNALHLHLSDDQAWRMEVKKYPLLTEVSSVRPAMDDMLTPSPGYYTQKQMKELVAWGEQHHVMIIPELEMPGHEVAAVHAYPQLTCGGKETPLRTICGVSNELLGPGSDFTLQFLKDVLKEYADVFPCPYVHLGGDEAGQPPLGSWTECPDCQALKTRLGISPVNNRADNWRLQKYLFDEVITYLRDDLGKTPMYWYEPDFKEIQPGSVTFAWRGGQTDAAIDSALKNKVKVMLCPGDHCYFDYPMAPGDMPEVNWGMPTLSLKKTYALDPAFGRDAQFEKETLFGVAGTLWSESINTPERITYQLFPRGLALAEAGWSPADRRNYDDFLRRLRPHLNDLQRRGISVSLAGEK